MIAQVFRLPSPPQGVEGSPDTQQFAQDAAKRQRDVEGCEGILIMASRATGETLAVTLWRDEAAMKAGSGYQSEEIEEARRRNEAIQVPSPELYEVFAHA
ncbi:MAG TPA: hypothetical protein VFH70_01375 [Acidimicrobiales bacterium]|nr:hypothetical protein [Acidimicrobiales bacterium]